MKGVFEWLLGRFSVDLGIDLGTANTLVCLEGEGIVLTEPSVVAVEHEAFGLSSGRTPADAERDRCASPARRTGGAGRA